jgi:RND superfamily putative drug exporter
MPDLARWCYRRRFVVAGLWLFLLAALGVATATVGAGYTTDASLAGTESVEGLQLLYTADPAAAGEPCTLVWQVDRGTVRDPAVRVRMAAALDRISRLPNVRWVYSPFQPGADGQISRDGRTAYAWVTIGERGADVSGEDVRRVIDAARAARTDGLRVELGGWAVQQTELSIGSIGGELIGVVAAAFVLFIAFRSLFAMVLPILSAVVGLGVTIMTIGLLSNGFVIVALAPTLAAVIGLGVGVDYAMFIVTRHRSGLKAGLGVAEALSAAVDTAGRAVLLAAAIVITALLGMFVIGVSFLNGMAVGAALAVALTAAASTTLLPALLGFVGIRCLSRRERRALAAASPDRDATPVGFWARWADVVGRRRAPLCLAAAAVMVLLTVPVLALRLGSADAGNNPTSATSRRAYDLLVGGFSPGASGQLQLAVEVPTPGDSAAVESLAARVRGADGVAAAVALPLPGDRTVGVVQVTPTTSPQSAATSALIRRLRTEVVPAAERDTGVRVYVSGQTAIFDDLAEVLAGKIPRLVAVIVGLGFLLLLIAFRSLLIPAMAAVMNLLAAGASLGVVVLFFQWGWGARLLGVGGAGPVEPYLPVIMLPVLFGLSIDYQVFLVSRMREEWLVGRDNRRAIAVGQTQTGRVITAAAAIMIAVFLAFVSSGDRIVAEFGIGLAAAVALDAFILRTALVPAAMHLFGPANWWLPTALDRRLPRLQVDACLPPLDGGSVEVPAARPAGSCPDRPAMTPDTEPQALPVSMR